MSKAPALLLALALVPTMGARQTEPAKADNASVRQRLAAVQGRLAQVDAQLEALKKRRKGVLVELTGIQLQRDRARAQMDGAKLRRDQAQAEADALSKEQGRIQSEVAKLQAELRRHVRWMQAVGPMGDLGFVPSFQGFEDYLARGRYLAWWRLQERKRLEKIRGLQAELSAKGKALEEVMTRLVTEAQEAERLQSALQLQEEKLNSFLDNLQQDEAAQKQVQTELAEEALQLGRLLSGLAARPKTESFTPSSSFAALQGDLPEPVDGSLAQGFGEHVHPRFHTKTVQSGILIEAALGAGVEAVAEGRVVFADSYQSYGPMVILDHGNGWFSLYTHLQGVEVAKGQVLRQGERLGHVGDTVDGPRLGFEIRYQSKAEDPNKWFKKKYR